MLTPESVAAVAAALAPAAPLAAALALGAWTLLRRAPSESAVVRAVSASLLVSLAASLACAAAVELRGAPVELSYGPWFSVGDYAFERALYLDRLAVAMMTLTAAVTALIARFSSRYLHREPGFARFFALTGVFAAGMLLLVEAASLDLLFAGWELVGLTSALLVAFFHDRSRPVRAGLRLFVTYRVCDLGLLSAAVLLHHGARGTALARLHPAELSPALATAVALGLLAAASGKSAQVPAGAWLPRAMEGPTPSSALFYGALSVHAGVYLVLRAAPLFQRSAVATAALVAVGATTTLYATVVGRAQSDAKGAIAYATMTQVGAMFVTAGVGLTRLTAAMLVGHAALRCWQILRAPSALRATLDARAAHGGARLAPAGLFARRVSPDLARAVYGLALERFYLDALYDRALAPVLRLAERLDAMERRLTHGADAPAPAPRDAEAHPEPAAAAHPGGR
ncbi:MAG: proton-conducting transporter membrane subunit [Polyangiales bacterium]